MSLSRHILPEALQAAHDAKAKRQTGHPASESTKKAAASHRSVHHASPYAGRYQATADVPKFSLPEKGVNPKTAYHLIHDETTLDGNPALNLASFVHTWMPDEGVKLMQENLFVNLADQDEYPSTTLIHNRCVSMIADLWNAPKEMKAIGSATTGSSEAILLGGLAMKKRWQAARKAAGKSIHEPGPNIVLGAEAHCSLEKFTRYFDVEARLVPVTEESGYVMDPHEALKRVDENTIGIYIIMGSTYTGHFENVKLLSDLLDKLQEDKGLDIPIHVDAASGGFFAPFVYPDLEWDFRLPRVHSINASGHKFGMSCVGVGWIVWKDESLLPKELIFELHYLGSTEYSFTLNFSRPAHPIVGQYFTFLNLGFEGYRDVMTNDLTNARYLSNALEATGHFKVLSDIHRRADTATGGAKGVIEGAKEALGVSEGDENDPLLYKQGLPVVSFRFTDEFKAANPDVKQEWVQKLLRFNGWIVPNYALAPDLQDVEILRVVVRESLTADMMHRLVDDIVSTTDSLINQEAPFVANVKGVHGGPDGGNKKGGDVERQLGSANQNDEKTHKSGTYSKQC